MKNDICIISRVTTRGVEYLSEPIRACTDYHDAIRMVNTFPTEPGVTYDIEEIALYEETDVDVYMEEIKEKKENAEK